MPPWGDPDKAGVPHVPIVGGPDRGYPDRGGVSRGRLGGVPYNLNNTIVKTYKTRSHFLFDII